MALSVVDCSWKKQYRKKQLVENLEETKGFGHKQDLEKCDGHSAKRNSGIH